MRAEIECDFPDCDSFGSQIVDHEEAGAWLKSDNFANVYLNNPTFVSLQDHHRETRPPGGLGGHDIFRVKFPGTGKVGAIIRDSNGNWFFQHANKEILDIMSTQRRK